MSNLNIHPHYQITMDTDPARRQAPMRRYCKPDTIDIEDTLVPGDQDSPDIPVRIYRPKGVSGAPMVMNVHGGGFVTGSYENDNNRASYLAEHIPAVVVSLNYRLLPDHPFPAPLMDCVRVYRWMYDHGEELGGDKERMGLFGTSAGGNLCAGLAFYLRDHGGPRIALNALNVPVVGMGPTLSAEQLRYDAPVLKGDNLSKWVSLYLGGCNGERPSYYAVPNLADDFSQLPPTLVVTAEYDPLRDYSLDYVRALQKDHVPVELYLMPRVGHGFDGVYWAPMSKWIKDGIVMSFQREFGLLQPLEIPGDIDSLG